MPRTPSSGDSVNFISVAELLEVLGPNAENAIKSGFQSFFSELGLRLAEKFIEAEVAEMCGSKHQRDAERQAVRWGKQNGVLTINGAREKISKARVRTADGKKELPLESYKALSSDSNLVDKAVTLATAGVSTRNYSRVLGGQIRKAGVSKSAVSRRVIKQTQADLEEFRCRKLDKLNLVAILIDGINIGESQLVAAVGVDKSGHKHVLGWNRGVSENFIVCRDLIRELIERGLQPDAPYLFVVDGSKGLTKSIRGVFGENAVIQRCQEHKIRDVIGYLNPKDARKFRIKLQAAFNQTTYRLASQRLQRVRRELQPLNEKAMNSLTEGMEATLTLHRLGIKGNVRESLRTTNIIESTFSGVRSHIRNVTNWQTGNQIERWLAAGLLKVESNYRRLKGFRQLSRLQSQVNTLVNTVS